MTDTDLAVAARVALALVLAASGTGKAFARAVPGRTSGAGDTVVAVGELALAALLLVVDAAWPAYTAGAVFALYTGVLVTRVLRHDRRPCNCFGALSRDRELSVATLLRNAWFLALAIVATGTATVHEPSAVLATVIAGVALAAVSTGLAVST